MYTVCIQWYSLSTGDLINDSNPEFAREFYRALSVVCDDLFFARYRRSAKYPDERTDSAAGTLLSAMFDNANTGEEKSDVVEELLDVKLLPSTDVEGVHFNKGRIEERFV